VIAGWRWVFYLNMPLGLVSLFMVVVRMPRLSHASRAKIDFAGAALIVAAFVPLLLALTFGGQTYPWLSPVVLGLFAMFALAIVLLIGWERRAANPIIHLELFRNPVFTWANIAGFLSSMSFLSAVAFLPLLMQLGLGVKATSSGLATLPLMLGLIAAAALAGRMVTRTGRYKFILVGGCTTVLVALLLLGLMDRTTSLANLAWRMALLGIGLGPLQSLFSIAVQNAVGREKIGVATSANQFFRQIGSTVGVAVFGTLLTNEMNGRLAAWTGASGGPRLDLSQLRGLSAANRADGALVLPEPVRDIIVGSVTHVILLSTGIVVLALLATLMVPELPMASRQPAAPKGEPPPDAHL
jgi:MFS family permease